jgi:methionyl-tRNA formyltransferase
MSLKIGYFADGKWSHKAFEKLIQDPDISINFICVRFNTQDSTLKQFCQKFNIDYLKVANINSKNFIDKISKYKCDIFVSMSFNQIFKNEIINLTKYKIINCHAGKLPFYRGRNILNWVLINDQKEFGITVHYVDKGIDTGDIILQDTYPITMQDDYSTLLEKAYVECSNILYKAVCLFKNGNVIGKKQVDIHPTGFYCSQRKFGDEILDWSDSSRNIFNFVRAICFPGPMARAFINGKEVKINKAGLISGVISYKCITGAILNIHKNKFLVKTGDSFIEIVEYETNAKFKVGDRFEIK